MGLAYDVMNYRYPSVRRVVYGRNGMVCTSQALAAQAGLDILKQGGNAADAALATAAAMIVLEPTSNGFGSDGFALLWMQGKLYGLNASGPAPALMTLDNLSAAGCSEVPKYGWKSVTVPGVTAGWKAIHDRFGTLSFEDIFAPAIRYAKEGYAVTPVISQMWAHNYEIYEKELPKALFEVWKTVFAPKGHAPAAGEIWRSPDHAQTFRTLADTDCTAMYTGELADRIDAYSRETGGWLRKEDLAAYQAEWVTPVSVNYRGYDVWEIPPNGHGIVAQMALNIAECRAFGEFEGGHELPENVHYQIEAMKMAFTDGQHYIADPRFMKTTVEKLLDKNYAKQRFDTIRQDAMLPSHGSPESGDTIYLCTADKDGNMVSYIQSNYCEFGSGIVIPGTGIGLQNRGYNFSMDPQAENCAAPGKKPYHTIIPGFLTKEGKAVGPFGVMGGFMQPQGHMQVMMNLIDFGMNTQEALDAPRWQWTNDREIQVECGYPSEVIEDLRRRGHQVTVITDRINMGRGQMILRNEEGTLTGATEPRTDGTVAAW